MKGDNPFYGKSDDNNKVCIIKKFKHSQFNKL